MSIIDQLRSLELHGDSITELMQIAHETALAKGFWSIPEVITETQPNADRYIIGTQIMNAVSELAEANEWLRKGNAESDHIPGFSGVEEEMADCLIRLFDLAQRYGWNIRGALYAKMRYNLTREVMHGKRY